MATRTITIASFTTLRDVRSILTARSACPDSAAALTPSPTPAAAAAATEGMKGHPTSRGEMCRCEADE